MCFIATLLIIDNDEVSGTQIDSYNLVFSSCLSERNIPGHVKFEVTVPYRKSLHEHYKNISKKSCLLKFPPVFQKYLKKKGDLKKQVHTLKHLDAS